MAYVTALAIFLGSMLVQLTDATSTVYDSKESSGCTTSQSRTQTRKHTECSCVCTNTSIQTTKDVFEQSTTNLFKDTSPTIEKQSTTKPVSTTSTASANPASCRVVCDDVIRGLIPDTPIGLASRGAEAEIFPEFLDLGIRVYCDCTNGSVGAWTRRIDGLVDFYRNWTEYSKGFGNVSSEFWLGLDLIHKFTTTGNYSLKIDLVESQGNQVYAEYSSFSIGNSSTDYTLFADGYSGDAGDSFTDGMESQINNLMPFSTFDRDNDNHINSNCAERYKSAWWFNDCSYSDLNARYEFGLCWVNDCSIKATELKFRKN